MKIIYFSEYFKTLFSSTTCDTYIDVLLYNSDGGSSVLLEWFSHCRVNSSLMICHLLLTLWRLSGQLKVEDIINKLSGDVLVIWLSLVASRYNNTVRSYFAVLYRFWVTSIQLLLFSQKNHPNAYLYNIIYNTFVYASCSEIYFYEHTASH